MSWSTYIRLLDVGTCNADFPTILRYGQATCCDQYVGLGLQAIGTICDIGEGSANPETSLRTLPIGYDTTKPSPLPLIPRGHGYIVRAPEKITIGARRTQGVCTYLNLLLPQGTFATIGPLPDIGPSETSYLDVKERIITTSLTECLWLEVENTGRRHYHIPKGQELALIYIHHPVKTISVLDNDTIDQILRPPESGAENWT